MRKKRCFITKVITLVLILAMSCIPVSAASAPNAISRSIIQPLFNNLDSVVLTIGFDKDNVVYCGLSVTSISCTSGVSGLMKLYDSAGNCLAIWSVSDYESPIDVENTYQGKDGETYTCTFGGYCYGKTGLVPDRLDLSVTGTCADS